MNITGAVVETAGGPFILQDLELDGPRPDEVVVRIEAVGLCHTDVKTAGGYRTPFPLLAGHEGAGVVEAVGSAVASLAPGDRVVASFAWCGQCDRCRRGHPAYCRSFRQTNFGGSRADGSPTVRRGGEVVHANFFGQSSFATHALVRAHQLVRIDDDVPFEVAAPLGCGFQTGAGAVLNVLRPAPGDSFALFGAGAVGLSALLAARAGGASPTVVVEPVAARRALALALGASAAVDPAEPGFADTLRELSAGGFDTALDTSGDIGVIRTAFEAVGSQGVVGVVAVNGPVDVALPGAGILGKQLRGVIEGDSLPPVFIPRLLQLWRDGAYPVDRLIGTFPLAEIDVAVTAARAGDVVKPVLVPG